MDVITHRFAYITGQIDLCAEHAAQPPEWVPSLGPVNHGQHAGLCGVCRRYHASDFGGGDALGAAARVAAEELDCDTDDLEATRKGAHIVCVRVR